ncbi:hypothetical protein HAX54_004246 [Datura stramonium]|uniref:Uncharacterized protein n=1 Tax=Datura stramonium TaxID=4076 RepID=A0ABS8T7D7_DATST|nr:hypothetical protein [Datura stramonium]
MQCLLSTWVSDSFPSGIHRVVNSNLVRPRDEQIDAKMQCLLSIMELALRCTLVTPDARISIEDTLSTLKKIRLQLCMFDREQMKISKGEKSCTPNSGHLSAAKQQADTSANSNVNSNTNGTDIVENFVQQTGQQLVTNEVQNNASNEFLERILE